MAKIFVCYRREDTGGYARLLFDRLADHFGANQIFMDVSAIAPGIDFVEAIRKRVADCDVVVAIVGRQWLSAKDADGSLRINNPNDYVRLEIASALRDGIRVIPALVGGAPPLKAEELPDDLVGLSTLNAWQASEQDFAASVQRLIDTLDRAVAMSVAERRIRTSSQTSLKRSEQETSELRRWILLYVPSRPLTWALHVLFFMVFGLSFFVLIATGWVFLSGKISAMSAWLPLVGAAAFFGIILLLLRAIIFIFEPDAATNRLRRWLLLYAPNRLSVALLHVFFFLNIVFGVLVGLGLATLVLQQPALLPYAIFPGVIWLTVVLVIREIASNMDPLRDPTSSRSWLTTLFFLWRPRTALAWMPRVIFYASLFLGLLLIFFSGLFDGDGNLTEEIRTVLSNAVLFGALIVAARGWSNSLQRRPISRAPLLKRMPSLLFPAPRTLRAIWFAWLLFVMGMAATIALLIGKAEALPYLGMPPKANVTLYTVMFAVLALSSGAWAFLRAEPAAVSETAPKGSSFLDEATGHTGVGRP